jgi:hypothetical protein
VSDDRYARVYFDRIERDPKFDGIRGNRSLMGSWQFLLVEAEKAWPSPAFPPPTSWVPRRDVELFASRGIIDMTADGRYELHGLTSIRAERSKRAAHAAGARWGNASRNASGIADAPARVMPRQDEISKDETSTAGDPADDYYVMTGKYPNDKVLGWIDGLTGEYGADAVTRALATCHQQDRSTTTLLGRAQDVLRRDARGLDRAEKVAELARIEANRPPKGVNVQVLISRHNHGQHADDPDANCPSCRRAA